MSQQIQEVPAERPAAELDRIAHSLNAIGCPFGRLKDGLKPGCCRSRFGSEGASSGRAAP